MADFGNMLSRMSDQKQDSEWRAKEKSYQEPPPVVKTAPGGSHHNRKRRCNPPDKERQDQKVGIEHHFSLLGEALAYACISRLLQCISVTVTNGPGDLQAK